jgi:Tfp pilus assembly protein PilV
MSLAELMVASAITVIVLTVGLGALASVQSTFNRQSERTDANNQAGLAIQQLEREIVSGNVLYDPALEAAPYPANYSLRIYTQSNANTRTPGYQCEQWVIDGQKLLRRTYPEDQPQLASGWRIVATDIVNRDLSPAIPAFTLSLDPQKGGRTVDIVLMVNAGQSRPVRIETSVTGRNSSFGFPTDPCPAPASM